MHPQLDLGVSVYLYIHHSKTTFKVGGGGWFICNLKLSPELALINCDHCILDPYLFCYLIFYKSGWAIKQINKEIGIIAMRLRLLSTYQKTKIELITAHRNDLDHEQNPLDVKATNCEDLRMR